MEHKYFNTSVDREIFTLKIICTKKFGVDKFSQFVRSAKFVVTVDGYKMNKCLECFLVFSQLPRYRESQLSLVITLWLSGVVVDWKSTSGGVDIRARLLVAWFPAP